MKGTFIKVNGHPSWAYIWAYLQKEHGMSVERWRGLSKIEKDRLFIEYRKAREAYLIEKYGSMAKYHQKYLEKRGFKNQYEYSQWLAKKNGYASYYEVQSENAVKRGFGSFYHYQNFMAVKAGFRNRSERDKAALKKRGFFWPFLYQEYLAEKNGFKTVYEMRISRLDIPDIVKVKGFVYYKCPQCGELNTPIHHKQKSFSCGLCSKKLRNPMPILEKEEATEIAGDSTNSDMEGEQYGL